MSATRSICSLLLAQFSCFFATFAMAQDAGPPTQPPKSPRGYLLIEEEQWNTLSDEPARHMGLARDAFLMMDARNASAELRKAAVHVRVAAGHATERTRQALSKSEHELERLAKQAEAGTFNSMEEFDRVTTRALHALATDQYAKATDAWRKKEVRKAGQFLRASANNLEHASARAGASIKNTTAVIVKDTRQISGKLIEGTGYVFDEIGSGFETFGNAIERMGTQVEPHTATK
ncbi:MAG: hypothetical protein JSS49_29190 [Planctomycetes bacterium]|nr:hypothetical protein [Planctomycetota bacterium]